MKLLANPRHPVSSRIPPWRDVAISACKILSLMLAMTLIFSHSSHIFAAGNLVVRLNQPKSPTNQNNFPLSFTALDTQDRPVTVKCFKKSPVDSSFSQFDMDKVLSSGGNSGSCAIDGSILKDSGSYEFYVSATAGP